MSSNISDGQQGHLDAQGQGPSTSIQGTQSAPMAHQSGSVDMTYEEFISAEYNMKHKQIGRAMVINNKNFRMEVTSNQERQRKTRKGTDQDRDAIVKVLEDLGFEGINYKNRKTQQPETRMVFENVQKQDLLNYLSDAGDDEINNYRDMDCFICVILSYGDPGVVYCPGKEGTDKDDPVELKKLMEPLKGNRCKTLRLQPKIFFIQGCPYKEMDKADDASAAKAPPVTTRKIPVEADFLTQSCNLPAYYGWNTGVKKSWYINALCDDLKKYCIEKMETSAENRSLHLLTVLTRVNQSVVRLMDVNYMAPTRSYQIPLVTSLLTKHLYFYRKERPESDERAVRQTR